MNLKFIGWFVLILAIICSHTNARRGTESSSSGGNSSPTTTTKKITTTNTYKSYTPSYTRVYYRPPTYSPHMGYAVPVVHYGGDSGLGTGLALGLVAGSMANHGGSYTNVNVINPGGGGGYSDWYSGYNG